MDTFPTGPGCYLMKGAAGTILYVGTAVNLRRRLAYYFDPRSRLVPEPAERLQSSRMANSAYYQKTARLVERVTQVEVILLNSATEGLILENNLIKRYHPPYNFALMIDGSGYTYLVQTDEPFPRLLPYRKDKVNRHLVHSGVVERFGPYLTGQIRDLVLKCVNHTFGLRTCDPMPNEACLSYDLGICAGPCAGQISPSDYAARVRSAAEHLRAPHRHLAAIMAEQMQSASDSLHFERARRIRDEMTALKSVFTGQVVEREIDYTQNVIWLGEGRACVVQLEQGKLTGVTVVPAEESAKGETTPETATEAFLRRAYSAENAIPIPDEVLLPTLPANADSLIAEITQLSGHPVRFVTARDHADEALLRIAQMNWAWRV